MLWLINAEADARDFVIPERTAEQRWVLVVDTAAGVVRSDTPPIEREHDTSAPALEIVGPTVELDGRSTMVLMAVVDEPA